MKANIIIKVNEAIQNFKIKNQDKKFEISLNEKRRNYPNGMYCHSINIYWDKFYDRICGNGWMWGQSDTIFFDPNTGRIIDKEIFTNNTYLIKDFTGFEYSEESIIDYLNSKIIQCIND